MSRSRNRNVKVLPNYYDFSSFKDDLEEAVLKSRERILEENLFGEDLSLKSESATIFFNKIANLSVQKSAVNEMKLIETNESENVLNSTNENICLNLLLGSNKGNLNVSSSSSLSWDDNYEIEITRKVQHELEILDRIFKNEIDIPDYYDKDEIQEWMSKFPNLTLLNEATENEEIPEITINAQGDCDKQIKSSESVINSEEVQNSEVSSTIDEEKPYDFKQTRLNPIQNRNIYALTHNPKESDFNRYLQMQRDKDRKLSSKSIYSQSSTRGYGSLDFSSLPPLPKLQTHSSLPQRSSHAIGTGSKQEKRKQLILPPIESAFRSISASPSKVSLFSNYANVTKRNYFVNMDRYTTANQHGHSSKRIVKR